MNLITIIYIFYYSRYLFKKEEVYNYHSSIHIFSLFINSYIHKFLKTFLHYFELNIKISFLLFLVKKQNFHLPLVYLKSSVN